MTRRRTPVERRSLIVILAGVALLHYRWTVGRLDLFFDPAGYALLLAGVFSLPLRPSDAPWRLRAARWAVLLAAPGTAAWSTAPAVRWRLSWAFWAALMCWATAGWAVATLTAAAGGSRQPHLARLLDALRRVLRLLAVGSAGIAVLAVALPALLPLDRRLELRQHDLPRIVYWAVRDLPTLILELALAAVAVTAVAGRRSRRRPAEAAATRSPRRSVRHLLAACVVLLAVALNGIGLWWLLLNVRETHADALVDPPALLRGQLPHPVYNKWAYPPLQHHIQSAVVAAGREVIKAAGLADSPVRVAAWLSGAARGVSAMMGVGLVALVFVLVADLTASRWAAFAAAFAVATNPVVIFRAHVTNVDTAYLMWSVAALISAARILKKERLPHWVWLGLFAGLSVATKDQAAGLMIGVGLVATVAGWRRLRRRRLPARTIAAGLAARLGLAAVCFVFTVAFVYGLMYDTRPFLKHVESLRSDAVPRFAQVPPTWDGYRRLGHLAWRTFVRMSWWPLPLLMAAGLIVAMWRRAGAGGLRWLAVPAVTFLAALAVGRQAVPRQLLPVFVLMSAFAGATVGWLLSIRRLRRVIRLSLCAVLLMLLWRAITVDILFVHDSRTQVYHWLRARAATSERTVTVAYIGYPPAFPETVLTVKIPHSARVLRTRCPDYVVAVGTSYEQFVWRAPSGGTVVSRPFRAYRRTSPQGAFYEALLNETLEYRQVARFKVRLPLAPDFLVQLNPEVIILRRAGPPAASAPVAASVPTTRAAADH